MARSSELTAALDRGIALWKGGQSWDALALLIPLSAAHEKDAGFQAIVGFVYYDTGHFAEAIPYLESAARLKPAYELAWRGLFHCRWALGERHAALEIARTLARLTDDPDDHQMVADIEAKYGVA